MKIPTIAGLIQRRVLLNYRVSPEIAQAIIPSVFRPKRIGEYAIAGICLIRLEQIRPKGFPAWVGIASENSAHRIAVEWDDEQGTQEGVFVPRRDTSSRLNALAGGRIFPGVHQHSTFRVNDHEGEIAMQVRCAGEEQSLLAFKGRETNRWPEDSVFPSLKASSEFFEGGCIGYSARQDSSTMDGLLLQIETWKVSLLEIHEVSSAFYDNRSVFPEGSITFDHALLMRDIPHQWRSLPEKDVERSDE